jgi:D-sedoheptulose 7-phosphate isomerase
MTMNVFMMPPLAWRPQISQTEANGKNGRGKFRLCFRHLPCDNSGMKQWIREYVTAQKAALDSIPMERVAQVIDLLRQALREERQIFVFGNGGSAANASHFVTDLGKGASDKIGSRFRCLSLNDNVSWLTALGNDYAYEEIFSRQLMNYARPGDLVLVMSVSGSSPNVVKAVEWAKSNGLRTIALVGGKKGRLAELAEMVLVIEDTHYGRVEDAHMGICHMLCYAFMENPGLGK